MPDPATARTPDARLDRIWLRRARARQASRRPAPRARLAEAVGAHLLEHLDPIRCSPSRILQIGADPGGLDRALSARYPKARVLLADDSAGVLRGRTSASVLGRLLRRGSQPLCADPGALPLSGATVELVCSNLALALVPEPAAVLRECRRVLRHGGLLMLSVLGPDSFRELGEAWGAADSLPHLHPFLDMHEVGDALVRAGFSDVVVDAERLVLECDDVDGLMHELRLAGGGNAHAARRRGLMHPSALERVRRAYPRPDRGGACAATVEAGYAHAWVLEPDAREVGLPGIE